MADKPTNKERLKELGEKIEAGIREVFDSDKYAEYLKVMSRFPTYSVNNQMLIRLQRPTAIFPANTGLASVPITSLNG